MARSSASNTSSRCCSSCSTAMIVSGSTICTTRFNSSSLLGVSTWASTSVGWFLLVLVLAFQTVSLKGRPQCKSTLDSSSLEDIISLHHMSSSVCIHHLTYNHVKNLSGYLRLGIGDNRLAGVIASYYFLI
jgi:hypothetical protein